MLKKITYFSCAAMLVFSACTSPADKGKTSTADLKKINVTYPATATNDSIVDDYFGTKVADPYRWLEDDNSDATKEWVNQQNLVTNGYLEQIPMRGPLLDRLKAIWNFEKFGTPFKEAGRYFFFKNDGLQNQSVLYVQDKLDTEASVLLDPNKFSADATTSLGELGISKDGKYLAFSQSVGGSDWRTIYVKEVASGNMLTDTVQWAKFTGINWKGDGFYYNRFPKPKEGGALTEGNKNSAIYYHKLGTPQSADKLIMSDKAHPNRFFGAEVTDDENFLIVTASESTSGNSLAFMDLRKPNPKIQTVVAELDKDFGVIDNLDNKLLVLTNQDAPNQRLILIDTEKPAKANWVTLIPENKDDVLNSASICGDKIVCQYLHDASSALRVFGMDGKFVSEIKLPEIGTVGAVSGKKGENQAFYSFQSFLRPNTIFSLDMSNLQSTVFKAPTLDFKPDEYSTEQVWYQSKDGTKVPMFITRKKGQASDGKNPTLLYGYGGFNISLTPSFSASRAVLLEKGGVYAVANIRGGGEFGEKWHDDGTKCKKQNVFDDFIGAAEYLIAKGYTDSKHLAIEGGSNGGLLVGACMTQRPELFAVAIPRVGVLDMLRYHQFTIGRAWGRDYGLSENEAEFKCLYTYSPLHNLKPANYPATLVVTADHDDRVVPAHSFKYAAALQKAQKGEAPTLIRIETSAGHGAGKPTSKLLEESADILGFMFQNMQ